MREANPRPSLPIAEGHARSNPACAQYADRCDRSKVISKSYWNKARAVAAGSDAAASGVAATASS